MYAGRRPLPGAHRIGPIEALSRTERIIAFCRVLLATATLILVIVDPRQPSFRADLAYLVLGAYVVCSGILFLLVRRDLLPQERVGVFSTVADIVWITLITRFTEGGLGPFFLLHVFVISSASVRWGLRATMAVTVVLAALYPATFLVASIQTGSDDLTFRQSHLFRPVYLLVLGYLIGYLGEHQHRSRQKLALLLDLPAAFRRGRPIARALTLVMRRALAHFGAERAIVVLRDPESGRQFTWDVTHRGRRTGLSLRVSQSNPLPVSFAAPTEAFLANDLRPGARTALCYDVLSGAITRKLIPQDLLLPGGAQNLLAAPILIQDELRGHAFVVREVRRKFTRDDLEFMQLIVVQAAAGLENIRLGEKAEEVAVLEERARIARDLHDGFIQSLAGIDLRIEKCKRLLQRDPTRLPSELEELHHAVDHGYRDVRRYLNVLRTAKREAGDLWTTLDRLAADFWTRERLRVELVRPPQEPDLAASTSFELEQIVSEALRNAVRHGHATRAVVDVDCDSSGVTLVVRDNGSGFAGGHTDADGFLTAAATPWSIRERTLALGGSLRVRTEPGRGAEVAVTIPAGSRAGRSSIDRRMYA